MQYPDEERWVNQFLEIWRDDCYGVHKLSAEPVVIDAGANIGAFALYLLWRCPGATITAIEPHPANLEYLRVNLRQYPGARITVIPEALGAVAGRTKLSEAASDAIRCGAESGPEVEVIPLEGLLTRPIDLLKMDIEGGEHEVLAACTSVLTRVRRIVVEAHVYRGSRRTVAELIEILDEAGFDRFAVFGHREFEPVAEGDVAHCSLVEAWHSKGSG